MLKTFFVFSDFETSSVLKGFPHQISLIEEYSPVYELLATAVAVASFPNTSSKYVMYWLCFSSSIDWIVDTISQINDPAYDDIVSIFNALGTANAIIVPMHIEQIIIVDLITFRSFRITIKINIGIIVNALALYPRQTYDENISNTIVMILSK